jgi:hypothetical protein
MACAKIRHKRGVDSHYGIGHHQRYRQPNMVANHLPFENKKQSFHINFFIFNKIVDNFLLFIKKYFHFMRIFAQKLTAIFFFITKNH